MLFDTILNGIHIGEHAFDPDHVIDEIRQRCVEPGFNFVTIRTRREAVPQHYFLQWAEYLSSHQIYFVFLYTVQHVVGRDSQFDPETVVKIKEIAGKYFLGDMIGETGSSCACKLPGYFQGKRIDRTPIRTDLPDMKAAHEDYLRIVSAYTAIDRKLGMPDIVSVEATALNKYNMEAGVTIPMLELMCGNPDILVSNLRGTARAYGADIWGTYIAHEWYGGMRHDDMLKRKRLELSYKYAYLAGSHAFCLESGDELIESYGHTYGPESEICGDYQKVLQQTMELIRSDARPAGGPKVKLAFVSGLHDAWGGWGGSSVWNQFHREEWGHGEAEYSWRIAEELGTRRQWTDIANYGQHDLSAFPAYGMYNIVPIEADVETLLRYDYLIFLGWNSMTEENLLKLTEYVRRGGHLLMSVAHLNTGTVRGGPLTLPDNSLLETLFGARFTGEIRRTNGGAKFRYEALDDRILYPGTKSLQADPIYSAGFADYAKFQLCGAYEAAFISDSFSDDPSDLPAVIENRLDAGVATLVPGVNYPGHPAMYPLYRALVREFITASARNCDLQILGSERLRYAVYEGNKLYLLNTDFDMPIIIKVIYRDREQTLTLDPLELRILEV